MEDTKIDVIDLRQHANAIPSKQRADILCMMPETQLHSHLKRLIERTEPQSSVEITHGPDEYGRDLVIRRPDSFGVDFVGVVVKRGDPTGKIAGRTAGPVDQVVSQANQATAHPCRLRKIHLGTVNITSVWVAFFGNLTKNAAERVQAEINAPNVRLFAIGELVDYFTESYPEVFFEGQVSDYLQDQILELETTSKFYGSSANLSEWYVDPWISVTESPSTLGELAFEVIAFKRRESFLELQQSLMSGRLIIEVDPEIRTGS